MPSTAKTRARLRRYLKWTVMSFVVLAVVSLVIVLPSRYQQLHRPSGTAASATPVPASCQLDPAILTQTHTHNFEQINTVSHAQIPEVDGTTTTSSDVSCDWGQTRGQDGINPRHLEFSVQQYDDPHGVGSARYQYDLQAQMPYSVGRRTNTAVPGLGDEATFAVTTRRDGTSRMRLAARQGNLLVDIYLQGEDRHLFWTTRMSTDEAKQVTTLVAQELLHRNW